MSDTTNPTNPTNPENAPSATKVTDSPAATISSTAIVAGMAGGSHVVDGPLTTAAITEASPSLLVNEIDRRIVMVRPMSTPVDQISRMIGARPASSMVVDYYSVDTKPVKALVLADAEAVEGVEYDGHQVYSVKTDNNRMFAATETLLVPYGTGYDEKGKPTQSLILYVVEGATTADGTLKVIAVNASPSDSEETLDALVEGSELVRMGRAASELDVQTAQFEALPVKSTNYCQIFKAQVEQSVFAKLSAREVGWTFSDQEEVAIMDMRLGMEKSFLFGTKARLTDPQKFDTVLFTSGIWNQAQGEFKITSSALTQEHLISLMRKAFTGNAAGSSRKILIAGSAMIEELNSLTYTKVIAANDTVTRWGIDFNEIRSKFGSLYVIHSEVFDQCGHEYDGLVFDPQYLTKYTHLPFRVEHLDLKKSGLRNTDAMVATEASCLVLRHPKAHIKVEWKKL